MKNLVDADEPGIEKQVGEDRASEVLLFPYLLLSERVRFGSWELVPRSAFDENDAVNKWVAEMVKGLLELYKVCTANGQTWAASENRTMTRSVFRSM